MGDGSAGSGHAGLRFQQAESRGAGLLLGDQESLPSNRGITGHASALARVPRRYSLRSRNPGPGQPAAFRFPRRVICPCCSLCEVVQASCAPIMTCYSYPWPAILRCGRFP